LNYYDERRSARAAASSLYLPTEAASISLVEYLTGSDTSAYTIARVQNDVSIRARATGIRALGVGSTAVVGENALVCVPDDAVMIQ
jgi:hypothetical protein